MFRKITIKTTLAGLAAAVALTCGVAYAQSAAPVAASGTHAGGWHHHHHHGDFEHTLFKLHDQLKLNAQSEALWQTAVSTSKANREQAHQLRAADKTQMQSAMQNPILDLNGMHAARQQQFQQFQQLHEQSVQAWLAVYSSLNDQQKTLVSSTLKAQWAQAQEHQAAAKARWQQQHPASGAAAQ